MSTNLLHSSAIQITLLALASLSLIGHGGGSLPPCLFDDPESKEYDVIGDCGSGRITVAQQPSACSLEISGDAVGIPTKGSPASLRGASWNFTGSVDGEPRTCTGSSTPNGDRATLTCTDDRDAPICTAFLFETSDKCDVAGCVIPTCGEQERIELSNDDCCPVCVQCQGCVPPTPPTPKPPVCRPEECPPEPTCEPHFELVTGDCCKTCQPKEDPELCDTGRGNYQARLSAEHPSYQTCQDDSECIVIQAETRCGYLCEFVVSGPVFGQPFDELLSYAQNQCQHCPAPTFTCSGAPHVSVCRDGRCVLDGKP